MSAFITKFLSALLLSLFLSFTYFFMPQTFFSLDNRLRDFMFVIRGELPTTKKVVIVDIDEKSLKEYGQWPWPRNILSDLIYKLTDAGAGIIGLDIVFAEKDRSSPHLLAKKFPQLTSKLEDYDKIFAKCLSQTPVVGGYVFMFEKTDEKNTPMIPAIFIEKGMKKNKMLSPSGVVLNIESVQDSLYSSGFFNNTPDSGGMIRSVPLVMKYDNVIYPSLALEMIRIYSGINRVEVIGDDAGVKDIKFGDYDIPTDNVGRLLVNFRGGGRHFKYISAKDILSGDFNKTDVKNKFILVGTSAIGLYDLRAIAFDNAIAGVEVHANEIDNILSGDYLYKPVDMLLYDIAIIWIIIFVFLMIFSLIKSWFILPASILFLFAISSAFYTLLFDYGVVLNLLFPFIAYLSTLIMSIGIDYIITSSQKEQAKRMLGKKVSSSVMEYLLKHSQEDLVASSEVGVSIFFSDIRSFTSIAEKIGSPDKLIHMLNEYMTPMVDIIMKNSGTVDKFIGDAIMAYWNAPIKVQDHADMAVSSAIEQIESLVNINKIIKKKYDVDVNIGIGIHTGIVTAGDMGSQGRSDYTIIGDNVNLASRLEGLNKQYGTNILISNETYIQLKREYEIRPIDLVEVKGKSKAVEIYEVICKNKDINDTEFETSINAINAFRRAKVEEAYSIFNKLQRENPSLLYEFYIERCKYFIDNPKLDFTPILKMTTK